MTIGASLDVTKSAKSALLVGVGNSGCLKYFEVIDLDDLDPGLGRAQLPDLPACLWGPTGQFFSGQYPVVCGGTSSDNHSCQCFSLVDSVWREVKKHQRCRAFAKSAYLESQRHLLVAGGYNGEAMPSVEAFDGSEWTVGRYPDLPKPVSDHCLVRINETLLLSIGGTNTRLASGVTGSTHILDIDLSRWREGPDLNLPRYGHSCGVIRQRNGPDGNLVATVVVVGGFNGGPLSSVEVLSFESPTRWIKGPELPFSAFLSTLVELEGEVVLVGGRRDVDDGQHLYYLASPEGSWKKLNQTVKGKTAIFISLVAPNYFFHN